MTSWDRIRPFALIASALLVGWFVWSQFIQPSPADCSMQRLEYSMGDLDYYDVDGACRDGLGR